MKITSLLLIVILPIAMGDIVLSQRNTCSCIQIQIETECSQFFPMCSWTVNYSGVGSCQATQCNSFESQADCLTLPSCLWNGLTCTTLNYSYCQNLSATATLSCQQQNITCFGTVGKCYTRDQLPTCQSYTTQQDCNIGQQGKCSWSAPNCTYYQNCGQIPLSQCNSFKPFETKTAKGQYCAINNQGICAQLTCNDLTTVTTCTYVQTIFNQDQFYLCSWNQKQSICTNSQTTDTYTQENCFQSTFGNYHWITNNSETKEGTCFQCQFQLAKQNSQCLCEQLVAELDCINAKICTWQSNKCTTSICSAIQGQILCASSPTCMWVFGQGCATFTKCADLKGSNQFQCLSQSTQCGNSNGAYCSSPPQDQSFLCTPVQSQYTCVNTITSHGYCQWNWNTYTCNYLTDCYNIQSEGECMTLKHYCYWSGYACSTLYSCGYLKTEADCTYVYSYGSIEYCQWNLQYKSCYNTDFDQLTYDQCYVNTLGQYRWSSMDNKIGACVQCTAVLVPKRRQQCECDQIIYQGDCALAGDSCLWKPELSQCVTLQCSMLKTRGTCISNYNCHWIQSDNIMQCLPFTSCDKLPGTNSYTCMLYSYRCTSTDGKFCKDIAYANSTAKCSSITDYTNCYMTVAQDGVCRWNGSSCYSLQQCSQINIPEFCGINNYSCYWNYTQSICQPLTCDMVTSESECTYFDQSVDFNYNVQMCYWNQTCSNVTTTSQLTSSDCFVNSAKTYRWSENDGTDGKCQSCSHSSILVLWIAIAFTF